MKLFYQTTAPSLTFDGSTCEPQCDSSGNLKVAVTGGGDASAANQTSQIMQETLIATRIGDITNPAAGSVNARLAVLSAQLPTTLGTKTAANSISVAWASDATLPAGTNLVGKVGIDQTTPGTTNAVSATGNIAAGVTDSGNPLKAGGFGSTFAPTAVTTGQRANLWLSVNGSVVVSGYNSSTGASVILTDANGTLVQPYAFTASRWQYAALTGGIVNTTTAVTIATAGGGSARNYLAAVQFDWDALGAATELVVRDGASGTTIWRRKIPQGIAGMTEVILPIPLKGTANTLMEVATLTASATGGVYFNAQGYTGT